MLVILGVNAFDVEVEMQTIIFILVLPRLHWRLQSKARDRGRVTPLLSLDERLLPPLDLLDLNELFLDLILELGEEQLLYFDDDAAQVDLLQELGKVQDLLSFLGCKDVFFQNVVVKYLDLLKHGTLAVFGEEFASTRHGAPLKQVLHQICQVERAYDSIIVAIVQSECHEILFDVVAVDDWVHDRHKLRQVHAFHHLPHGKQVVQSHDETIIPAHFAHLRIVYSE